MPRGGPPTYTYSLPAVYLAVPGTTILATQHNSPLEDIADVLNEAWPTNLGGTGGTSLVSSWDSLNSRGDDIPTASTIDLDAATGANVHLTGTTTITAVSLSNGVVREAIADSAFTITASSSLVVNGNTSGDQAITAKTILLFIGGSAGVVYVLTGGGSGSGSLYGYTTTATAAGTTTLTVASTYQQYFTGTTTQTVALPVTSTLTLGFSFRIVNNSTGAVTVNSSGGNLVMTVPAGTWTIVTCILLTGTTAASWSATPAVATTSVVGPVQLATNAEALGATSTARAVDPANLAQERTLGAQNVNVGLSASVNASALTVSLTGIDGSAPSATDPVTILFRNATIATGTPVSRLVTGSTSITVASTKTLGTQSSNVPFRLWIVAVDTGTGIELGVVNALSGTSIMALRPGIYSPTATPGNSAQVIYTTSGQTSKPIAILGYMEWASGLATAGTWASGPTTIKLWQPGDPLPGETVQTASSSYSASATGTTTMSASDVIPTNTTGDQYMSQAITPLGAANLLKVQAFGFWTCNSALYIGVALFRDSTVNALTVSNSGTSSSGVTECITLFYFGLSNAATATTFKIRAGGQSANTTTFGGASGTRQYGAIPFAWMAVTEIMG